MREHSSVGSEHLLYTQRVIGSSPIVPTGRSSERTVGGGFRREYSSAGLERMHHTHEVAGSNPAIPTERQIGERE